jgi:hypothetical protein
MRVWSLVELFRLTRVELFGLHRQIVAALGAMPEASPERGIAYSNLRRIARVLALPTVSPR